MRKVLVTIVGRDHPGIIHLVSQTLADSHCNVIEVTQTTLLGQFAGIFSCTLLGEADLGPLSTYLQQALDGRDLSHWIAEMEGSWSASPAAVDCEPYVVTVWGQDQPGLIPEFTGCIAGFDINVENLRAVALYDDSNTSQQPPDHEHQVIMFFELSVPRSVNPGAFRQALSLRTEEMNMEMSLQHRDIFEAIHRL